MFRLSVERSNEIVQMNKASVICKLHEIIDHFLLGALGQPIEKGCQLFSKRCVTRD